MHFNAFNINAVPRLQNVAADLLATSASRLVLTNNKCSIELIFRPSVPDNIANMSVFDDDEHIINFLTNEEYFKQSTIDEDEHQSDLRNGDMFKGNFMPKGVRMLERMFDLKNKFRKPTNVKTNISSMQYGMVNLG